VEFVDWIHLAQDRDQGSCEHCSVAGSWRRLRNEELRNLTRINTHYYGDQVKEDGMDEAGSMCGRMRNAYKVVAGKVKGKGPVGRHRISIYLHGLSKTAMELKS